MISLRNSFNILLNNQVQKLGREFFIQIRIVNQNLRIVRIPTSST